MKQLYEQLKTTLKKYYDAFRIDLKKGRNIKSLSNKDRLICVLSEIQICLPMLPFAGLINKTAVPAIIAVIFFLIAELIKTALRDNEPGYSKYVCTVCGKRIREGDIYLLKNNSKCCGSCFQLSTKQKTSSASQNEEHKTVLEKPAEKPTTVSNVQTSPFSNLMKSQLTDSMMNDGLVKLFTNIGMPCAGFSMENAEEAYLHMKEKEQVQFYGSVCGNNNLYTWDDGYRTLMRCKNCGGYILVQISEFHGMEDDMYYADYFPVSGPEEAGLLNREYDGFAIEEKFPGKWMCCEGRPHWYR